MQVIRTSLTAAEVTKLTADRASSKILVKNFTEGSVCVCVGESFQETENIRIAPGMYEIVSRYRPQSMGAVTSKSICVKAEQAGDVEARWL